MANFQISYSYKFSIIPTLYQLHWPSNTFRKGRDDERRLGRLLPASALQRRRLVNSVNMKTTFICWLVEFIGSLLLIGGPFITGHNNVGWGVVQILLMFVYFIMLPFTYFINSSETKNTIADSSWMHGFLTIFKTMGTAWVYPIAVWRYKIIKCLVSWI